VNLAAYTNVDGTESEAQKATELNVLAPGYLAAAALACGARFLHISTDYVFGGADLDSYGEDDPLWPIQKYGETKADGEAGATQSNPDCVIARVSWLYGPGRRCFPLGLLENFRTAKPLRIVADQFGVPSYTAEVARMLLDLMDANAEPGIYHVAGSDAVSRFEYAQATAKAYAFAAGVVIPEMTPVPSTEFPTPAARPRNSVLRTDKVRRYTKPHLSIDEAMAQLMGRL
jgi:dTDP-4-dehydrorhamnose reductase